MFGNVGRAVAPSACCPLTPAAQQWAQSVEDNVIGGHCEGFSIAALRLFTHDLNRAAFGGKTTFSLAFTPALESEIEYGAVVQFVHHVQAATLAGPPAAVVSFLARDFSRPHPELYVLGIAASGAPNAEGHAIVPTGV